MPLLTTTKARKLNETAFYRLGQAIAVTYQFPKMKRRTTLADSTEFRFIKSCDSESFCLRKNLSGKNVWARFLR